MGPVIAALAAAGVPVSVDTMRAEVAEPALEAGARLVNDVSGGLADPQMPRLVARGRCPLCGDALARAQPQMDDRAVYGDVVGEVSEELRRRVDVVAAQGVDPAMIVLDPGLGFAKRPEHNWALLTSLDQISSLGGRARLPGPDRRLAQAVPGQAAGRAGWHPAAVRRPRRRDRRGHRAGRGGRGLVRPGARGAGERRRGTGRGGLAAGGAPPDGGPGRPPPGRPGRVTQTSQPGPDLAGGAARVRLSRCAGRRARDGQEFIIDAVLWLDTAAAAANDDLALTADYAALADRLAAVWPGPPVRLIETLAQRLAEPLPDRAAGPRGGDHRAQAARPGRHRFEDVTVTIGARPRERRAGTATVIPGRDPSSPWAATSATGWPICRAASTRSSTDPA